MSAQTTQAPLVPRTIRELFASYGLNDSQGACLLEDQDRNRYSIRSFRMEATVDGRNEPITLVAGSVQPGRPAFSSQRIYQVFGGIASQNALTVRIDDDLYHIVALSLSPDPAVGSVLRIAPKS